MTSASLCAAAALAVFGLAYLSTVFLIAHQFTTPTRVAPIALPDDATGRFARVSFQSRGDALNIVAWYRAVSSATAAVVMVHGRDGCRGNELRCSTFGLAERIAAAGMSVVMIDLRGHGDSGSGRLTFGRHEYRDVLGAVDFLLARGYQPTKIGVFGASMGGVSGIAAAAAEPAIGALIIDSAFADLELLLRAQFRRLTRLPTCFLRGALLAARILTGTQLTAHPPRHLMRVLRGRPVLVIHAAGDPFVPVRHAHLLANAGNTALWITPGARHLSSASAVGARYLDVVARFFAEALVARSPRVALLRTGDMPPVGFSSRASVARAAVISSHDLLRVTPRRTSRRK